MFDHRFTAMGGPCRLRLDCADETTALAAIAAAEREVRRLEQKYSRYRPGSLVARINAGAGAAPVAIDEETAGLLGYADTLWRESGGRFDPTSGLLRRAWDFRSGRLPAQAELDALLPLVGWERVEWDAGAVRLPLRDMELDFGGFVKEYAADSAAGTLARHGIRRALVELAGDIAVVAAGKDTAGWEVGIRHPGRPGTAIARIHLARGGLASSGDYERCMDVGGRRYGHILDPGTGWPVGGLVAVSVVADQCLVAGGSATIAMLQPPEQALEWLAALGLPWFAVDAALRCHGSLASGVADPPD